MYIEEGIVLRAARQRATGVNEVQSKGHVTSSRSQELLPKYIEQDAKQESPSQFAEQAGSGLQAGFSSKELRGLSVRAQVRV